MLPDNGLYKKELGYLLKFPRSRSRQHKSVIPIDFSPFYSIFTEIKWRYCRCLVLGKEIEINDVDNTKKFAIGRMILGLGVNFN